MQQVTGKELHLVGDRSLERVLPRTSLKRRGAHRHWPSDRAQSGSESLINP
jgi:hypothetical protein